MDSFTVDFMEDSYIMDLCAFAMIYLSSYVVSDWVCDLDIVADLV